MRFKGAAVVGWELDLDLKAIVTIVMAQFQE